MSASKCSFILYFVNWLRETVWNCVILNGDFRSHKSALWNVIMLESKHFWLSSYLVLLFHVIMCAAVLSETKRSGLSDVPFLKKQLKATGFKLFETFVLWVLGKGWSIITTGHLWSELLNWWEEKSNALLNSAQKGHLFFLLRIHYSSCRTHPLYFRTWESY